VQVCRLVQARVRPPGEAQLLLGLLSCTV